MKKYLKAPTPDPRCGTRAGWVAHRRRGEVDCWKCFDANAAYREELKRHDRGFTA